jgi:hypothetical protein
MYTAKVFLFCVSTGTIIFMSDMQQANERSLMEKSNLLEGFKINRVLHFELEEIERTNIFCVDTVNSVH